MKSDITKIGLGAIALFLLFKRFNWSGGGLPGGNNGRKLYQGAKEVKNLVKDLLSKGKGGSFQATGAVLKIPAGVPYFTKTEIFTRENQDYVLKSEDISGNFGPVTISLAYGENTLSDTGAFLISQGITCGYFEGAEKCTRNTYAIESKDFNPSLIQPA